MHILLHRYNHCLDIRPATAGYTLYNRRIHALQPPDLRFTTAVSTLEPPATTVLTLCKSSDNENTSTITRVLGYSLS